MVTLDHAISVWDSEEHTAEEKLETLQMHVFHAVGLSEKPDYYIKNGKLLERFAAGFIYRYFSLLKDVTFLFLDPLHIIDVVVSFVKSVFTHPVETLKHIWKYWSGFYTKGAFGVGMMMADTLLAALVAGATAALAEGETTLTLGSVAKITEEEVVKSATALPRKLIKVVKTSEKIAVSYGELAESVMSNPQVLLESAKSYLKGNSNFWGIRKFKHYASGLIRRGKSAARMG